MDTAATIARLRALYANRATHREAAAAIGKSPTTAWRWAKLYHLPSRPPAVLKPATRKKLGREIAAYEQSCARLAEVCGVSTRTAWLAKRRAKVSRRVAKWRCCGQLLVLSPCPLCGTDKCETGK
jgi:hypothetical protein